MTTPTVEGGTAGTAAGAAPSWEPPRRVTPASPSLRRLIAIAIACMPILVPAGPGNTSPADVPIVLAVVGIVLWLSRNRVPLRVPYAAGMWLMMLAGAVASLANWHLGSTAVLAQDLFLLVWGAAIACAVSADRSLVRLVCVTWCWSGIVCAGLLVVGRLGDLPWLAGQTARDGSRSALTFGDPNLAGNYFVASLFLLLAFRYPRRRVPRVGAVLLVVAAIVFTGSNGAMLGMVVGLAAGVVVGAWRTRGAALATVLAAVLAVGGGLLVASVDWGSLQSQAASGGPILHDSFGRGDSSSQDRQVLFAEGSRLFWNGTLVGIGPGRTQEALASIPAPYVKEAHNDYMATMVELGVVGGLGLVVLLASVTVRLARVAGRGGRATQAWRGRPPFAAPHFLVSLGASFLVAGLFYEVLHFRHLWAFLGLVAGVDLLRDQASARWSAPDHTRGAAPALPTVPAPAGPAVQAPAPGRGPREPAARIRPDTPSRSRRRRVPGRAVIDNIAARLVAVLALGVGTIVVARTGGAEDVGVLALLRVVPGLVGVLAACGLSGAMGYFLAGPHSDDPRLWPTIIALLTGGAVVGTGAWMLLLPLIPSSLFGTTSTLVMVLAGVSVGTQLPLGVAKASLQGLGDRHGSNAVTAAEELAFLPAFAVAYLLGLRGPLLLVVVLIVADVVVAGGGWVRLVRQVHRRGTRMTGHPDLGLARSIVSFGLLGQVGGLVNLLNLRLDFLVLGALAGPAPLGVYAVASKFAELARLPALAVTWVSYPRMARLGPAVSGRVARRQLPWLAGLGIVSALALAVLARPLLPAFYGPEFLASVPPAVIIAVGLVASPAGGLASGYLLGTRRPGTNSVLQIAGLLTTLVLDVLLIPPFGLLGAAVASALAYLVTDLTTLFVVHRLTGVRHGT